MGGSRSRGGQAFRDHDRRSLRCRTRPGRPDGRRRRRPAGRFFAPAPRRCGAQGAARPRRGIRTHRQARGDVRRRTDQFDRTTRGTAHRAACSGRLADRGRWGGCRCRRAPHARTNGEARRRNQCVGCPHGGEHRHRWQRPRTRDGGARSRTLRNNGRGGAIRVERRPRRSRGVSRGSRPPHHGNRGLVEDVHHPRDDGERTERGQLALSRIGSRRRGDGRGAGVRGVVERRRGRRLRCSRRACAADVGLGRRAFLARIGHRIFPHVFDRCRQFPCDARRHARRRRALRRRTTRTQCACTDGPRRHPQPQRLRLRVAGGHSVPATTRPVPRLPPAIGDGEQRQAIRHRRSRSRTPHVARGVG